MMHQEQYSLELIKMLPDVIQRGLLTEISVQY